MTKAPAPLSGLRNQWPSAVLTLADTDGFTILGMWRGKGRDWAFVSMGENKNIRIYDVTDSKPVFSCQGKDCIEVYRIWRTPWHGSKTMQFNLSPKKI